MKVLASLLCTLAAAGTAATAQTTPAPAIPLVAPAAEGFSATRLERLSGFMQAATDTGGYLGAVVLIARRGHAVDWRAYGRQDLARQTPMQRDAIFRIYSMTKPIATVAALMLMEEGKLGLEDPVALYLPEFAGLELMAGGTADAPVLRAPARPVTIRHLLTHTAGLATGSAGMEQAALLLERAAPQQARDLREFAARVSAAPLGAEPGTHFRYDGVGIEVLSRIVEIASGQSFDAFLRQRIFEPLRMTDTGFEVPTGQRSRVVDLTTMGPQGELVRASTASALEPGVPLAAYRSGAGGLYSTAPDYLRFCQMLLNGGSLDGRTLLGRKTVELMMTNQLTQIELPVGSLSAGEGFGLGGWVVIDAARRGRLGSIGAFGWSGAASTYFTIDPKEQLIAILLMQHLPKDDGRDLAKISSRFYNLVYQALVQ